MQKDLLEWGDNEKAIRQQPPCNAVMHRNFIIDQLSPIMEELDKLDVLPIAKAEALQHYANKWVLEHQESLLNG